MSGSHDIPVNSVKSTINHPILSH